MIKHKNELQVSLDEKNISIALINETHLTNNKIFSISGYSIYVTNHPDGTTQAGSAIYINVNFFCFCHLITKLTIMIIKN